MEKMCEVVRAGLRVRVKLSRCATQPASKSTSALTQLFKCTEHDIRAIGVLDVTQATRSASAPRSLSALVA
jgi:hypothetical protein